MPRTALLPRAPTATPAGAGCEVVSWPGQTGLSPRTARFYRRVLRVVTTSDVPVLVGGAYAFACYTGIERHTKDLDLFVKAEDCQRLLDFVSASGFRAEVTYSHWLAKIHCGDDYVDVIFSSGNGVAGVDDEWFAHALQSEVLGVPVWLVPAEEMIWQKAYIMERERYDGADVAHTLRARAEAIDWERLRRRFGPHWRVLLSHLILFGLIYPSARARIPRRVMDDLLDRLRRELDAPEPADRNCQGTLLSRSQYLVDVERWGYRDARLPPHGKMSRQETAMWTAAIEQEATEKAAARPAAPWV